jgi:hypothetical protein
MSEEQPVNETSPVEDLALRHLRTGWGTLLLFLLLGLVLEGLHGFKVGWYLDVSNDTRRHMFTLAHSHGTLLALVHLAFVGALGRLPDWPAKSQALASALLTAATVLLPGGFFAGGVFIYAGDPGLGILLVPLGALALAGSVALVARAAFAQSSS